MFSHLFSAVRPKVSMWPIMVELRNELNLFDSRLLKSVELDDMADRWSPQWRRSEASPDWNSDRIVDRNDDVAPCWLERQDEYRPDRADRWPATDDDSAELCAARAADRVEKCDW